MIDICPVGALTSKPFRYSARTWELSRRKSVSPHDSTGANLVVQVKAGKVMRVLPLENEPSTSAGCRPRPLLLRGAEQRRPPDAAHDQAGRPVAGGGLEHRARLRGRRPEAREGGVRQRRHRRAGQRRATVEELHLLARWCVAWAARTSTCRLRHADFGNLAAAGQGPLAGHLPIASLSRWIARWSSAPSCARTTRCWRSAAPGRAPWRAGDEPARGARRLG
jgi:NADH-quinone oxidoreductase subunit G